MYRADAAGIYRADAADRENYAYIAVAILDQVAVLLNIVVVEYRRCWPYTTTMWESDQTVEEEGGEDAAAMTEGMATGPEEEDRMVYVRRNRELLDNLDGWSIDALVNLYEFLREQRVRPSPPPSYKEPPLSRQAPPPPIPKPKYMPTLPKSGQIRRCLDRYRCPEPTATPTQMPEPEPNEAQPQEPHGPASSSVLDSPIGLLESLDSTNVLESLGISPWCPVCLRYDRCQCDEEEVVIARHRRREYTRSLEASLRFEMQQNPEWEQEEHEETLPSETPAATTRVNIGGS